MRVLIIGTGRVAFHLGHAIKAPAHHLLGVVGRNTSRSTALAEELGCSGFVLGDELPATDLVLIAVSDDAIAKVAAMLQPSEAVVAHTSGATDLEPLNTHANRGVLWPLVTMSPGAPVDLKHMPVVIDANNDRSMAVMRALASSMSDNVSELGHAQRELVHTAAAISTNFPLILLDKAQQLLRDQHIDPALLMPSFQAMARKAKEIGPREGLTGPARRGDQGTVKRHMERLTGDPELRRAYALLSEMIMRSYGHDPDGSTDL